MCRLLRFAALALLLSTAACARAGQLHAARCITLEAPHVVPRPNVMKRGRCGFDDLRVDARIDPARFRNEPDAYTIDVDSAGIRLYAVSASGRFYARQTLEQLTVHRNGHAVTPDVHIEDAPRYRWRGMHLDVARHFFDTATLEKSIDVAARYKLNVVHLHFTDNEAWRLPSTRFSRLPSTPHYSEAALAKIVRYAERRYVTIVPEIDLPAHTGAAIRAYPSLSCGSRDTLCPEGAQPFANDVVREAAALFPKGTPIHLGGDEVEGWSTRQRSAFFRQLSQNATRTVVWDDAADAAPHSAAVMVWHLGDAASRAAAAGHPVIMAQDGPLYFNAAQGDAKQEPPASKYMTTLEQVYAYDPGTRSVLGIEATLWTEKIATPEELWYMLLPRELALAEVAWTQPRQKDWRGFRSALPAQLSWLAAHGYRFRVPNVTIEALSHQARYASVKGNPNAARLATSFPTALELDGTLSGAAIAYRIDGGTWQRYGGPISVNRPATIEARQTAGGRTGAVTTLQVLRSGQRFESRSFDAVVSP